ncbi:MAG TPA: hypothetical protein VFZ34_00100 [Blastocatellia bacterium]|nr:hypothetical protein [Blastocatellia bacterium]
MQKANGFRKKSNSKMQGKRAALFFSKSSAALFVTTNVACPLVLCFSLG